MTKYVVTNMNSIEFLLIEKGYLLVLKENMQCKANGPLRSYHCNTHQAFLERRCVS